MNNNQKILHGNRVLVASLAILSIYTDSPLTELFAVASVVVWLWLPSFAALEKKLYTKIKKLLNK